MVSPKKLLPKNIFTNWLSLVINAVIMFFLTPFLVHRLGEAEYGIWALVFSILSYSDFFDLGVRQSLAKYIPKYYALKDNQKLNEVINSSNAIYVVAAALTMVLAVVVALFGVDYMKVSPEQLYTMRWTMVIIGANAAAIFLMMPSTAIGPFHRYDIRNAISIGFRILETAAIVYFIWRGIGLIELASIVLISTIARLGFSRWAQQKLVPALRMSMSYINKGMIRQLLGYGTYSFLIVIAMLVVSQSDYILIGTFIDTTTVTYYSVAVSIMSYLRAIVQVTGLPLTPAIAHFEATNDMDEVKSMSRRMLKYAQYMATSVCAGIFIFGSDFINLWMGEGFDLSVEILMIIVIPAVIYLPQTTSNAVLFGIGRHKLLFHIVALEAVSKIILSVILLQFYGVYGIVIGTAIPQILIYSILYPVAYHRALGAKVKTFYLDALKVTLIALGITAPAALLIKQLINIDGWTLFIVAVGLTTVLFCGGFLWLILDPEDQQRVKRMLARSKDQG